MKFYLKSIKTSWFVLIEMKWKKIGFVCFNFNLIKIKFKFIKNPFVYKIDIIQFIYLKKKRQNIIVLQLIDYFLYCNCKYMKRERRF